MSLLKVNEIQIFNGTTVTITATTTETSADLNVGADLDVTGALTLGTALAVAEGGTGATDAATARINLDVDQAGTDNSTDVSLVTTSHDYLSIASQAITLGPIDLAADVTGTLATSNGGTGVTSLGSLDAADLGSGAATDGYVLTADGSGGAAWEAVSGGSVQSIPIPNWYLAEQQITGGNDVSEGFYVGSSTAEERRTVNIPAMQLRINATVYTLSTATTLDADTAGSWASNETSKATAANRNGEDVYIYAVEPSSGSAPNFCLSSNSTYPDGTVGGVTASATNSRKIGGFHCLCVDVGTISGHSLTGYLDGDILPRSVWTQASHRPTSNPEGMVYVGNKLWADIYLASNTTTLESSYGGTIVDGASNPDYHWYNFAERFAEINKRLPTQAEFMALAIGSNEETNISGSADPGTTGGHSDTAGRRMISNVGCEDCAGALWQWCNETGSDGAGASFAVQDTAADATTYDGANSIGRGQGYAVPNRGVAGGDWSNGAECGSRGVGWNSSPLYLGGSRGARGVSASLY